MIEIIGTTWLGLCTAEAIGRRNWQVHQTANTAGDGYMELAYANYRNRVAQWPILRLLPATKSYIASQADAMSKQDLTAGFIEQGEVLIDAEIRASLEDIATKQIARELGIPYAEAQAVFARRVEAESNVCGHANQSITDALKVVDR